MPTSVTRPHSATAVDRLTLTATPVRGAEANILPGACELTRCACIEPDAD